MEITYRINVEYWNWEKEQTTTIIDLEDLEKWNEIYELLYENIWDCQEWCDKPYTWHCYCYWTVKNIEIVERFIDKSDEVVI